MIRNRNTYEQFIYNLSINDGFSTATVEYRRARWNKHYWDEPI
jgi:hypothetical protein